MAPDALRALVDDDVTTEQSEFRELGDGACSENGLRPGETTTTTTKTMASSSITSWQVSEVSESCSVVSLFVTPWTVACQAPILMGV